MVPKSCECDILDTRLSDLDTTGQNRHSQEPFKDQSLAMTSHVISYVSTDCNLMLGKHWSPDLNVAPCIRLMSLILLGH